MFELIKFTKSEYVEGTLQGKLYMNSLGYFWTHGVEDQNDIFEGIAYYEDADESYFKKCLPEDFRKHIHGNIAWRNDAIKYCNVFCMYKLSCYQNQVERIDKKMEAFGDKVIHIYNTDAFLERLIFAANKKKDFCWCAGDMKYYDNNYPCITAFNFDCFCKIKKHAYQKEWRILVLNQYTELEKMAEKDINAPYNEPYLFEMEDIHDIARVIDTIDLIEHQEKYFPNCKIVDRIHPSAQLTPQIADMYYYHGIRVPRNALDGAYWGHSIGEKTDDSKKEFNQKLIELSKEYGKPMFTFY